MLQVNDFASLPFYLFIIQPIKPAFNEYTVVCAVPSKPANYVRYKLAEEFFFNALLPFYYPVRGHKLWVDTNLFLNNYNIYVKVVTVISFEARSNDFLLSSQARPQLNNLERLNVKLSECFFFIYKMDIWMIRH